MKLFKCQSCGQMLYFENTHCERCGRRLGYLPGEETLSALEAKGDLWRALALEDQLYRFCADAEHGACNWLVPAETVGSLCAACRHNRMVPDLYDAVNLARWQKLELAKHHLFYSLFRLGLPLPTRPQDPRELAFDFLADPLDETAPRVTTGHAERLITINVKEADDAERERMRSEMGEPYRTLLGHFRHEVGISSGTVWCGTAPTRRASVRASATSGRAMAKRCRGTTRPAGRRPAGRDGEAGIHSRARSRRTRATAVAFLGIT